MRLKSIAEFVLKNFGLYYRFNVNAIAYGTNDGQVVIKKQVDDSFFQQGTDLNFKSVIRKEWKGSTIPFCFAGDTDSEIITVNHNQVIINYDIIASSFYFLSGWNELVNPERDYLGRSSYKSGAIHALDIALLPVVNYYFDILYEALLKVGGVEKKSIWENHTFAVNVTHDIDTCRSAWTEGSLSELRNKRFLSIPGLVLRHFMGKDAWFNFAEISATDKDIACSSTFFFLPRQGKSGAFKNADYNISSGSLEKAISELSENGHEIGLHAGFGTHNDVNEFEKDKAKIKTGNMMGNRFHFLMFDPLKTVAVLEEAGIAYDTSLGFAEQIGFRRSFCHPFYLFDFEEWRTSNVIEIPLLVMDATLHYRKYMNLSREEATNKVLLLIDEVARHNGVFTILWHNTFFSSYKYGGWKDIYLRILNYCKQKNALITSGKQIYERIITGKNQNTGS